MQLNELNNKKNKLILKKLKLVYKYKMNRILLIIKVFIIDNILDKMIIQNFLFYEENQKSSLNQ